METLNGEFYSKGLFSYIFPELELLGQYDDLILAVVIACSFPLVRFILDTTLFQWSGERAVFLDPKKSDDPPTEADYKRLEKWKESFWKTLVYTLFSSWAIYVAYTERLFVSTQYFWDGCSRLPCEYPVSIPLRILYCLEMGFYVQAIPSLIWWEVRRKDFKENMGHHFVTLVLIVYSYYCNLTKPGCMVFLLHDINDIFLELAKLTRYARKEALTTAIFVFFMITWFSSRIYYFPVVIIRSTIFESYEHVLRVRREEGKPLEIQPHYTIFNGLLLILFCLHIFWSYLILRIAYRQVTSNELTDEREDDD